MNISWINVQALFKAVLSFVNWESVGNFCIAVVAFLLAPLAVGFAVDTFIPIRIQDIEFWYLELWLGGAFILSVGVSICLAVYVTLQWVWERPFCDTLRERFYRERVELVWANSDFQTHKEIEDRYLPAIYRENQSFGDQDDGRLTLVESRHTIPTGVQTRVEEKT